MRFPQIVRFGALGFVAIGFQFNAIAQITQPKGNQQQRPANQGAANQGQPQGNQARQPAGQGTAQPNRNGNAAIGSAQGAQNNPPANPDANAPMRNNNGQSPQGNALIGAPGNGEPQENGPTQRPPLPKAQADYMQQALNLWEQKTKDFDKFSCNLKVWKYNPSRLGIQGDFHYAAGEGEVKYMKPDKGMFKVESFRQFTGKLDSNSQPEYKSIPELGDWWLCDGMSIHEYRRAQKEVLVHELPKEMQGKQIVNSPLPFVFGIEAQKVLDRYWAEPNPQMFDPAVQAKKILIFDFYPKRIEDALNYQKVTIFLRQTDFMPLGLRLFDPGWSPENPVFEHYEFSEHALNQGLMQKIKENIFMQAFLPNPPADFKVIRLPYNEQAPAGGPQAPGQPQRVAQPPVQPGKKG